MLGRRRGVPLADGDAYLRANGSQDDLLQAEQSSARLQPSGDSAAFQGSGFFRRGGQPYEGLLEEREPLQPPAPAGNGHAAAAEPRHSSSGSDGELSDGEGPERRTRSGLLFSGLSLKDRRAAYMPMTAALNSSRSDGDAPIAATAERRGSRGGGRTAAAPPQRKARVSSGGEDASAQRENGRNGLAAGNGGSAAAAGGLAGPPQPRPSPGLMSSAAKLAASLQQGSKRTLLRRKSEDAFEPLEDSAVESVSEGSELASRSGAPAHSPPPPPRRPASAASHASPGHRRPLLDSADGYEASSRAADRSPHSARALRPSEASRDAAPDGVAEAAAFDIFEPRPDAPATPAATPERGRQRAPAASPSLQEVCAMKGTEALQALRSGALLRKKWVGSPAPAAAAAAPKTERHIKVRVEDGRVVLRYHHQGVKGLLEKEEVAAAVQRVEVQDGPWRRGDCLLLHTARGVLALEAPDAATHATWMLGLNAALVAAGTARRDVLLQAPARAIPRNAMFVVTPPGVAAPQ